METGTVRLLTQLPYRMPTLIAGEIVAVSLRGWLQLSPAVSAMRYGRRLAVTCYAPETFNLLLGPFFVRPVDRCHRAVRGVDRRKRGDRCNHHAGGHDRLLGARFHAGRANGMAGMALPVVADANASPIRAGPFFRGPGLRHSGVVAGLAALAAIWLRPGLALAGKLTRSSGCDRCDGLVVAGGAGKDEIDRTEDRRNSFPAADQHALRDLREPLVITVHLVPEDPRYVDLRRNVLSKLERVLPNVTSRLATSGQSVIGSANDKSYGEVEYIYGGRRDASRSTSHREILPLLYGLAKIPRPSQSLPMTIPATRLSRTPVQHCRGSSVCCPS